MPSFSRTCCGDAELTRHAPTISAPPATSFKPSASPSRPAANSAAQSGSVESSTDASDEESLPRAVVSPSRLAAVVTRPVHATAAATVRMLGSSSSPGSVDTALLVSSSIQPSTTRPSPSAQTAVMRATTAHCAAVMGSACEGSRAIIFSVMKKEVPKPTACSTDQKSPQPRLPRPPSPASSSSATPDSASNAAIHVCGAWSKPLGLLSTTASSSGFHTTMSAPRKETVAAEVSTSAMLCAM
mmetsp:Transcript_37890/g.89125  ORF Transcript_37890/g.89125 Transcript_37890/m.89125 type:complete len:242 (+) Transcript_37890:232-957(+)